MWLYDQSLVTLVHLLQKLSLTQFIRIWPEKPFFFEGYSLFRFNNLAFTLSMASKFYTNVEKRLQLKVKKFLGLFVTFVKVKLEKLIGRDLFATFSPSS